MTVVGSSEALIRLIEIELVNQFQRFLKKHSGKSPKTCRFNSITPTPDGGYIRICRCPVVNSPSPKISAAVASVAGKPCTTLAHAKRCPVYQHYTGVSESEVTQALIDDFFSRIMDPGRRSTSFKTLHTLWILLHENMTFKLSLGTRIHLRILSVLFKRKYLAYMLKSTPQADYEWDSLTRNFNFVLTNELPRR